MVEALGWSGRNALFNEGASIVPPRELPESLKRGPLGGCLRICGPCGGILVCEFILQFQSFISVLWCRGVAIDHALVPVFVYMYFGCDPGCK